MDLAGCLIEAFLSLSPRLGVGRGQGSPKLLYSFHKMYVCCCCAQPLDTVLPNRMLIACAGHVIYVCINVLHVI